MQAFSRALTNQSLEPANCREFALDERIEVIEV